MIRYAPIFFIILLSILTTSYITNEHLNNLEEEKIKIKKDFIKSNKEMIQVSIDKTISKYIKREFKNSEKKLKLDIKNRTYQIHKRAMNIYNKNKYKKTKEEIITDIKTAIETSRFDEGRGYFFIYDLEGINILHPIKPKREGKSFFNAKDIKGTLFIQESIKIAKSKEKEGFHKWFFHKPGDFSKEYEKIGFIKKFEPYNWFIGTGLYLDDFQNQIKKRILNHLSEIQYENNKYIFVLDNKSNILLSKNKKLNETNLNDTNNIKYMGKPYEDFVNSKEKSTFIKYQILNNENQEYNKEGYLKKIESLGWVVGRGFNLDEVNLIINEKQAALEKDYDKHLNTLLITLLFTTLVLLLVSYYVSKYIEKRFIDYEKALIDKERIKFELVLKELRDILDNLPMMIIYKDTHNNIITVNKQTADSLGKSIEELTHVPSKDIFPQDYKKYYSDDLEVIESKKAKIAYIEKYESKDGCKIIESSKIPLFNKNGNVENIILFMKDITYEKDMEEENKKKNEFIHNFVENANAIVCIIDDKGVMTRINKKGREFSGYTQEEIAKEPYSWLRLIPEDIRENIHNLAELAKEDKIPLLYENPWISKEGEEKTFQWSNTLFKKNDGSLDFLLSIGIDVSYKKVLEEQSRLASMGQMIGNIAHQWRQPLNIITTSASGIRLNYELDNLDLKDLDKSMNLIVKQAHYLSNTIDNFKNFIKGDKSYIKTSIVEILEESIDLTRASLDNNYIKVVTDFKDDSLINCSKNEMIEALINIINNSKDAIKENVKNENDRFVFICTKKIEENKIRILIKDSGGGIPDDVINRVFEPYFTTKHKSQGTGLGLQITDKIIRERLKGELSVSNIITEYNNKKYKGACLSIILNQSS